MEILKWIKRIFSVGTLSVMIAILTGIVTYMSFFRDAPGKITLMVKTNRISKQVSDLYFLMTVRDSGVDFLEQKCTPYLANNTQRTITDFHSILDFYSDNDFQCASDYAYMIDSTESKPRITVLRKVESIGYLGFVSFPLNSINVSNSEPQITHFGWSYIHKGMKDSVTYQIRMITIPERLLIGKDADSEFLKLLRPYLLDNRKSKSIAIVYQEMLIENPRLELLKNDSIDGIRIENLK